MCVRIVKYLNDDFLDMIVPNDVFDDDKVSLYSIENGGWYIMNHGTGYTRKLSKANEILLVENRDIDYEAIEREFEYGVHNAREKAIRYAGLGCSRDYEDGFCLISWMLYPDGAYFADSDGYGMKDNDEEVVYAVFDKYLNIIAPFRPVEDVDAYMAEFRERNHDYYFKQGIELNYEE